MISVGHVGFLWFVLVFCVHGEYFFYALLANVGAVIVLYGWFLCCLNLLCCYLSPWQFIRSR